MDLHIYLSVAGKHNQTHSIVFLGLGLALQNISDFKIQRSKLEMQSPRLYTALEYTTIRYSNTRRFFVYVFILFLFFFFRFD